MHFEVPLKDAIVTLLDRHNRQSGHSSGRTSEYTAQPHIPDQEYSLGQMHTHSNLLDATTDRVRGQVQSVQCTCTFAALYPGSLIFFQVLCALKEIGKSAIMYSLTDVRSRGAGGGGGAVAPPSYQPSGPKRRKIFILLGLDIFRFVT